MVTIYAPLTGPVGGAISVVRVSGVHACDSLQVLTNTDMPEIRKASLRTLYMPHTDNIIDEALVTVFKAPNSFTGEDCVEYALHGGRAVMQAFVSALSSCDDHRMAEPGEFSRQAFINGKMDLTQAEAIADLVAAETDIQRQQALLQKDGVLLDLYEDWRARLIKIMAYVEAEIDFPDEGDIPEALIETTQAPLKTLNTEMSEHLNDNNRGERIRDGLSVVIVGAPNAGKSSLLNLLAKRDVAIVSDIAGTTRDVLEVHMDLGGYPVTMVDTAGLRPDQLGQDGHDQLEAEGIKRALERAKNADILLVLFDGSAAEIDQHSLNCLNMGVPSLAVINKSDIGTNMLEDHDPVSVSVTQNTGINVLMDTLNTAIRTHYDLGKNDTPSLTRARHREALESAQTSIKRALQGTEAELIGEDLRLAARALGRITGRVDVDEILDVVFRDFCLGK